VVFGNMNLISILKQILQEEKSKRDRCLRIADRKFDKPSAYKSGAVVIEDMLGNVDLNFNTLEANKKKRFQQAFETGTIELPIAVKFDENNYDLVAGNTRLAGLVDKGIDPLIWIVDLTSEILTEKQKETLRTWFKRKGAPGKTGGWVD